MKFWKEAFSAHDSRVYVLPNCEADVAPLSDEVWAHRAELKQAFIEAWPHAFEQHLVELHADDPSVLMPDKTVLEAMNEALVL